MTDPSPRKTEFWWASIGGAQPEPVEKCTVNDRPAVYTLGCGDPFFLDESDCSVKLGTSVFVPGDSTREILDFSIKEPMDRPALTTRDERKALKEYRTPIRQHSWRGPR